MTQLSVHHHLLWLEGEKKPPVVLSGPDLQSKSKLSPSFAYQARHQARALRRDGRLRLFVLPSRRKPVNACLIAWLVLESRCELLLRDSVFIRRPRRYASLLMRRQNARTGNALGCDASGCGDGMDWFSSRDLTQTDCTILTAPKRSRLWKKVGGASAQHHANVSVSGCSTVYFKKIIWGERYVPRPLRRLIRTAYEWKNTIAKW